MNAVNPERAVDLLERAAAMLKAVQHSQSEYHSYSEYSGGYDQVCPCCENDKGRPHASDCGLWLLVTEIEEALR